MGRMASVSNGEGGTMEVEVKEFVVSTPRYLQPFGESVPRLIEAAPGRTAKVFLPSKYARKVKARGKDGKPIVDEHNRQVFKVVIEDLQTGSGLDLVEQPVPTEPRPDAKARVIGAAAKFGGRAADK